MLLLLFLLNLIMVSSTLTASKKPGEPLIISDIKKGSMAHRYFLGTSVIFLCKDCMFRFFFGGGGVCHLKKNSFQFHFVLGVFCFVLFSVFEFISIL